MAQRKQSAGARKRNSGPSRHATVHAGEKPARDAERIVRAGAAGAEEMTRRTEEIGRRTAELFRFNGEAASGRLEEASRIWSALAQDALRQNVETAQNLMRCRTVSDVVEVQTEWLRRSLDNFFERGSRLSELSAELAADAVSRFGQPMQAMGR